MQNKEKKLEEEIWLGAQSRNSDLRELACGTASRQEDALSKRA